jgi:hypothetical protein
MTMLQSSIEFRYGQPWSTVIRTLLFPLDGGKRSHQSVADCLGIKRSTLSMWIRDLRADGALHQEAPVV